MGEFQTARKLTPVQRRHLAEDRRKGMSWTQLRVKYGVGNNAVGRILVEEGVLEDKGQKWLQPNTGHTSRKRTAIPSKRAPDAWLNYYKAEFKKQKKVNKDLHKQNLLLRRWVNLMNRRVKRLESQVRQLGGTPITETDPELQKRDTPTRRKATS